MLSTFHPVQLLSEADPRLMEQGNDNNHNLHVGRVQWPFQTNVHRAGLEGLPKNCPLDIFSHLIDENIILTGEVLFRFGLKRHLRSVGGSPMGLIFG